jgi:hypothetical protein
MMMITRQTLGHLQSFLTNDFRCFFVVLKARFNFGLVERKRKLLTPLESSIIFRAHCRQEKYCSKGFSGSKFIISDEKLCHKLLLLCILTSPPPK